MIEIVTGNIFESDADAYVCPVNCMGITGRNLVIQFKDRFPACFYKYSTACKSDEVQIGKVFPVPSPMPEKGPAYVIHFPTKMHWLEKSQNDYIAKGLVDLVKVVESLKIKSIAVPALGCGHGGLKWDDVKPMIESAFQPLGNVRTLIFSPQ